MAAAIIAVMRERDNRNGQMIDNTSPSTSTTVATLRAAGGAVCSLALGRKMRKSGVVDGAAADKPADTWKAKLGYTDSFQRDNWQEKLGYTDQFQNQNQLSWKEKLGYADEFTGASLKIHAQWQEKLGYTVDFQTSQNLERYGCSSPDESLSPTRIHGAWKEKLGFHDDHHKNQALLHRWERSQSTDKFGYNEDFHDKADRLHSALTKSKSSDLISKRSCSDLRSSDLFNRRASATDASRGPSVRSSRSKTPPGKNSGLVPIAEKFKSSNSAPEVGKTGTGPTSPLSSEQPGRPARPVANVRRPTEDDDVKSTGSGKSIVTVVDSVKSVATIVNSIEEASHSSGEQPDGSGSPCGQDKLGAGEDERPPELPIKQVSSGDQSTAPTSPPSPEKLEDLQRRFQDSSGELDRWMSACSMDKLGLPADPPEDPRRGRARHGWKVRSLEEISNRSESHCHKSSSSEKTCSDTASVKTDYSASATSHKGAGQVKVAGHRRWSMQSSSQASARSQACLRSPVRVSPQAVS